MTVGEHACPVCGRVYRTARDARECHGIPEPRVARYIIGALTAAAALLLIVLAVVG